MNDIPWRLASALLVYLAIAVAPVSAASLLIRNVTPIDPIQGALPVQDILLVDGTIERMGIALKVAPGTRAIDASGRFVIPGLWDMHVHLSYEPRLAQPMASLFLDHGITSVRDTGGVLDALLPIVESYRAMGADAPRVYFSGPLLDGQPVVYDGGAVPHIGIGNRNEEEARRNVATLAQAGASFIKIYEMVSPPVFEALVEAAAERNLPIAAHVPLSMLASQAGPQVQSMEHLRNIEMDCAASADDLLQQRRQRLDSGRDESGLALRGELHGSQRNAAIDQEDPQRCQTVLESLRNTIQVPTARLNAMTRYPPFEREGWSAALATLPDDVADEWSKAPQQMDSERYRQLGAWTLRMIPRLRDAGVPIGAGTDTPIGWAVPGYSLHSELEILVDAGLSALQALQSATVVPARFLGLESSQSRLASGYVADLVILDANPLASISNTRQISAVIARGELVREAR